MNRGGAPIPATELLVRKDVWRLRPSGSVTFQVQFGEYGGSYVNHCHNTVHEDFAMLMRIQLLSGSRAAGGGDAHAQPHARRRVLHHARDIARGRSQTSIGHGRRRRGKQRLGAQRISPKVARSTLCLVIARTRLPSCRSAGTRVTSRLRPKNAGSWLRGWHPYRKMLTAAYGESRGGISPPHAAKTVHERLELTRLPMFGCLSGISACKTDVGV